MAKIVIAAAGAMSHFNSTFKLAHYLEKVGHQIIYVTDESKFKDEVLAQGFNCELFEFGIGSDISVTKRKGAMKCLYAFVNAFRFAKRYEHFLLYDNKINEIKKKINPSLIILDTFLLIYAVKLYEHNPSIAIFQTKVSVNKDKNIPPPNSTFIPQNSIYSFFIVELLWLRSFIKRRVKGLFYRIVFIGSDSKSVLKHVASQSKFPLKSSLDCRRLFSFGLNSMPELILSPKALDFPHRKVRKNQIYLGPTVDIERSECHCPDYDYIISTIKKEKEKEKIIIYCSLGTISSLHTKHSKSFLEKVINLIKHKKKYFLIVSVGAEAEPSEFDFVESEVLIYKKVPQIGVLKMSDLMITHGGMQSITECILVGVPMIVYPLNSVWDQNGNSSRVVYHQLGLRGSIERDEPNEILTKISQVCYDPLYKLNINKMKNKFLEANDFEEGMKMVSSMVNAS